MTHQIIQITDCHLFADQSTRLRDVHTWPRFEAVVDFVRDRFPNLDYLVMSGDTAHDEVAETYRLVRDRLGDLVTKMRIIPGNHDNRAALKEVFPECCELIDGRTNFTVRVGNWQLIGLDSHIPGEVPGLVGEAQIERTRTMLRESDDSWMAVFIHHPPVDVGSPWLDEIGLQDANELLQLVSEFDRVRLMCCGHIHQESAHFAGGTSILTSAAVGPQFRPRTVESTIDVNLPPALRVIDLEDDGSWSTQVLQLPAE